MLLLLILGLCQLSQTTTDVSKRVVYAINCGGPEHIGEGDIVYKADSPIAGAVDSDFGQKYYFVNAHDKDRPLYQTERYSLDSFTYTFPAKDGQYVMILKFSEVYFTRPGQKVFDVKLNGIPIIKNLDIFKESNFVGAALDKRVEFKISKGTIQAAGQKASIGSVIEIELAKGLADNPKINAIAILKGGEDGLPPLPLPFDVEDHADSNHKEMRRSVDEYEAEEEEDKWQHMEDVRRMPEPDASDHVEVASGPRAPNPYEQQTGYMGIVLISLVVLTIPVVFLLQRVQ